MTKRPHRETVRLTDAELGRLLQMAGKMGLTPSACLRHCLMDARPVVVSTDDEKALRELSRQVAKIGGHTNQVARVLNARASRLSPDELRAFARELSRVTEELTGIRVELAAVRDREGARIEEVMDQ